MRLLLRGPLDPTRRWTGNGCSRERDTSLDMMIDWRGVRLSAVELIGWTTSGDARRPVPLSRNIVNSLKAPTLAHSSTCWKVDSPLAVSIVSKSHNDTEISTSQAIGVGVEQARLTKCIVDDWRLRSSDKLIWSVMTSVNVGDAVHTLADIAV